MIVAIRYVTIYASQTILRGMRNMCNLTITILINDYVRSSLNGVSVSSEVDCKLESHFQ